MERRFSTRDTGLAVRMTLTLASVVIFDALIVGGLALVIVAVGDWWPVVAAFAGVFAIATLARFRSASALALGAAGGRRIDEHEEPELHSLVARLAVLADLPPPRLAIVETTHPNAFTVGIGPKRATIAVTTGLRELLSNEELEAVVAHEMAHVANRDAGVMTVATIPRTLGETMINTESNFFILWYPLWWLGLPIWAVGSLLTLTLSRYREFTADRGSALLTGRPEELMSALQKLADPDERIPDQDLRQLAAVDALCVVSRGSTRLAFFSDHPPLHQRLERLADLARGLGSLRR